jgi:Double-GTPase 2
MRSSPDTPHTAMELRLLHLGVVMEQTGDRVELFMADRRGEQFQGLLDRPTLSDSFPEIKRGDSIAFLLDGEHLVDGSKREAAISKVQRLAMALRDSVARSQAVQLIVTKIDKIQGHADEPLVRSRIDALSSRLAKTFDPETRYTVHHIAARELEDESNGLSSLLSEWLRPPKKLAPHAVPTPLGNNAFERLMNLCKPGL